MNWLDDAALFSQIGAFLAEDLGRGDITTQACVARNARARGRFLAKEPMVVAGLEAPRPGQGDDVGAARRHLERRRRQQAGGREDRAQRPSAARAGSASVASPAKNARTSPRSWTSRAGGRLARKRRP